MDLVHIFITNLRQILILSLHILHDICLAGQEIPRDTPPSAIRGRALQWWQRTD